MRRLEFLSRGLWGKEGMGWIHGMGWACRMESRLGGDLDDR
jgi:hypothetical protein